ncbi:MAG TPA: winged helix DNA-binding domain-containing protein [Steroidobacteraceae bacterium]
MKTSELLRLRLHNQQLTNVQARKPGEVVSSLVAMQAQEYAMSRWAIALRMSGSPRDADIERAFNAGEILRTHVLRPTWHFVAPEDIRWLLALTAPRVHAANAYMYRQLDLDASVFKRSNAVLVRALQGEQYLTRSALQTVLAKAGVKASGPRLGYLMMNAELEALICSGPREGKQFTYALLETRVPAAKAKSRDVALAELSHRYFASRGPATAQDFAMWSGLTLTEARAGIESLGAEFVHETVGRQTHVFRPANGKPRTAAGFAFLMPDYDEYGMSYKDRRALLLPALARRKSRDITLAYNRMIVVDGQIVGSWRRGESAGIETAYLAPLSRTKLRAVTRAIKRFTAFMR